MTARTGSEDNLYLAVLRAAEGRKGTAPGGVGAAAPLHPPPGAVSPEQAAGQTPVPGRRPWGTLPCWVRVPGAVGPQAGRGVTLHTERCPWGRAPCRGGVPRLVYPGQAVGLIPHAGAMPLARLWGRPPYWGGVCGTGFGADWGRPHAAARLHPRCPRSLPATPCLAARPGRGSHSAAAAGWAPLWRPLRCQCCGRGWRGMVSVPPARRALCPTFPSFLPFFLSHRGHSRAGTPWLCH